MKSNLLKRTLALTVAAAMTISSAPANLVFAEEEPVIVEEDAVIVEEEPAAAEETAAGTETELSVEPTAAEEAQPVAEDDFVADIAEIASEDVPENVAVVADIDTAEPVVPMAEAFEGSQSRITNVTLDPADSYRLSWEDEGKDEDDDEYTGYEISIVDGAGNAYYLNDSEYAQFTDDGLYTGRGLINTVYSYSNYLNCALSEAKTYEKVEDEYGYPDYEEKTPAFQPGTTYVIKVRGYSYESTSSWNPETYEYDYTYLWTGGSWSEPLTYTVPTDTAKIQLDQVKNVHADPNNANILCWDAVPYADAYEIEVKSSDGTVFYRTGFPMSSDEYYLRVWGNKADLSGYSLYGYTKADEKTYSSTELRAFNKDQKYLVSVRATRGYGEEKVSGAFSAEYTYQPVLAKPNKPTEVKIEDGVLSWRSDNLDGEPYYEMEVTDELGRGYYNYVDVKDGAPVYTYARVYGSSANLKVKDEDDYASLYVWKMGPDGYYIQDTEGTGEDAKPIQAFQPGHTYKIRIRAFRNVQESRETSDWVDAGVFAYEDRKVPEKTGGLTVKDGYVTWNSVWNSASGQVGYQVRVTSADETTEFYADITTNEAGTQEPIYGSTSWNHFDLVENSLYAYTVSNGVFTQKKDSAGKAITAFERGQSYKLWVRADNRTLLDGKLQTAEWSDPIIVTIPEAKKVAKVTAVVDDDENDSDNNNNVKVSWECDSAATGYEIDVLDAEGNHYYAGVMKKLNQSTNVYESAPYYWNTNDDDDYDDDYDYYGNGEAKLTAERLTPYEKNGNAWIAKKDANNNVMYAFQEGKTYTIAVRGIYGETKGEFSTPVTITIPARPQGQNTPPAVVTGVELLKSASVKDHELTLDGVKLQWNPVFGADYYEIRITDAAGNEYLTGFGVDTNETTGVNEWKSYYHAAYSGGYSSYGFYIQDIAIRDLTGLKVYTRSEGSSVETVKDAQGKELKTFVPGTTYNFQVRAVNVYREWDAAKNEWIETEYPCDTWSDAVSYTQDAVAPITDLAYAAAESAKSSDYLFTYSAALANSKVYYQIATDANFNAASLLDDDWTVGSEDGYKLAVPKDILKFGATYYIRALNSISEPTDEDIEGLTIPFTSFRTDVREPKNITGLALYKTTGGAFEFCFDTKLDRNNGDQYELQYNTSSATAADDIWIDKGQTTSLSFDDLPEGNVYVRVVAYIQQKNEQTGKEEKIYGAASNVLTVVVPRDATAISGLKLAEKARNGYVFKFTGDIRENEYIEYWYSQKSDFQNSKKYTTVIRDYMVDEVDEVDDQEDESDSFEIPYSFLTPGTVYYVRARVYNSLGLNKDEYQKFSAFTNTVKLTAQMPEVSVSNAAIEAKSITLHMSALNNDHYLTGYEIQKKAGKKYEAVAKTTDNTLKVDGLETDTAYTFRVRPYYYNPKTAKTTNGAWVYHQATTWGGALNLKATVAGKTAVKLSWSKLSGATGYEIYRTVGVSATTEVQNGYSNAFTKRKLVKTVLQTKKTKKTVTYTDKQLTNDLSYTYTVRAYREVGEDKFYIDASASVGLGLGNFSPVLLSQSNGKVKATWNRVYGADGYLIEKYSDTKNKWESFKTLKSSKTSYTFPAAKEGKVVKYRIRAYQEGKGKNKVNVYSAATPVDVIPLLAVPTDVKAKANKKDGSIKVTWKAVAGADYYRVYRTTSSWNVYNKTTKSYTYDANYQPLELYVEDATRITGYRLVDDTREMKDTSFVDRPITYTVNGVENTLAVGPTPGVTYYYYVQAFKYDYDENTNAFINTSADANISSGYSEAASAKVSNVTVDAPKIKKAKATKGKVTVTWKKTKGAVGYEVYRKTSKKGAKFELIGTVKKAETVKYTDKTTEKGTKYVYKVRAIALNEAGLNSYSKYSKTKSVKAK